MPAAVAGLSLFILVGLTQAAQVVAPSRALPLHQSDRAVRQVASDGDAIYYIVRLKDAPAATYRGGVPGLGATDARSVGTHSMDTNAPATTSYAAYLEDRQSALLESARRLLGRALTPRFQYRYALNGLSLKLNRAEAMQIGRLRGVVSVEPVRHYRPVTAIPASATDTNASRSWISAPAVWQTSSGSLTDTEGEGLVLADLDTGINHANSSFKATGPKDGYTTADPGSLRFGVCDGGNATQSVQKPFFFSCNDKLIGAYTYTQDTGNDPDSPEDSEGHGSHTASTAVGDFVSTTVDGASTPLSGVAPHASLIAYDVCDPVDFCATDASVAAVDQAIQDQGRLKKSWGSKYKGMVLNFSIGGSDDAYGDSVEQAFLSAVEAGIYVSVAGGNGGPANAAANDPVNAPLYPVQHVGPWVVTNAAATHDGISGNDLENFSGGDSATLPPSPMAGASGTSGVGPVQIVYSGDSAYIGQDPAVSGTAPTSGSSYPASQGSTVDAQQCLFPFSPGTIPSGAIVACDRGTNPLVDKAYNVKQGGAGGVVIMTTATSSQDFVVETYVIPGTLLHQADGDTLRAWLTASVGSLTPAQAQLTGAVLGTDASQADQVAGFSSRGPTDTAFDAILKPDLTAPGVSVLAAVSNPLYTSGCSACANQPESYEFFDGTSMAAPHDTGAAALLMQAHPKWTSAEVKSAMMLTAVTTANGTSPGLTDQCASLDSVLNCVAGATVPSPQVRGAGRIDVDAANRTGLILDENGADYAAADPNKGGDLTSLNLPSLASADCPQTCSWTRTLKSAFTGATVNYSVGVSGASTGLNVLVSPASFSLAPGASQTLTVTADVGGVKAGSWAFAQLDIATSDTGDGSAAIPAMHLTLAAQSVTPSAHMSLSQDQLDYSEGQGKSSTSSFSISNQGQKTLSWTLSANGGPAILASAPAASPGGSAPLGSLWSQSVSIGDLGYPSTFYAKSGHGVYVADTFSLPIKSSISSIVADGFVNGGSGFVSTNGPVNWYIYADSNGAPAGNPEDGKNGYLWHYSGTAAGAGVSTANGNISLDLAAAGQTDVSLPSGSYWLIVVPTTAGSETGGGTPTWYWFEGKPEIGTGSAQFIDPADAYGGGKDWQALSLSFAFTLSGSMDCTNTGMPGLSLSPMSGSIKPGGTEAVAATFKSGKLAAGKYQGAVCVSGNASDHPVIALPVSATVTGGSSGSGGGGGELGMLELVLLALLTLHRRLN
ncbi:MAG: S8 family serine peptidase [Bacillota bacterium]